MSISYTRPNRRYRTSRTSGRFFVGKPQDDPEQTLVWTDEPGRVMGTVNLLWERVKPEELVRDWRRYVVLGNNLTIEHRAPSAQ
jgi:hypothetical protein